jgi:hypothetical protein
MFCYGLLIIAHIALVWKLAHFPLQDGPSDLYKLVILDDLDKERKDWGRFLGNPFVGEEGNILYSPCQEKNILL